MYGASAERPSCYGGGASCAVARGGRFDQFPGVDNRGQFPALRKVALVVGYQVVRACLFHAFQQPV